MTPLRQQMIRAMELHRLTQATKDAYLQAIVQLAKFHSRSPDQLSAEEVRYRDRRHGDRRKHTKLPVDTFLKRFLCHVLPERFMRIRHYGFLANRYRREKLGRIRCLLGVPPRERLETPATVEWLAALLGIDLARCPCCGGPLSQREIPRDES